MKSSRSFINQTMLNSFSYGMLFILLVTLIWVVYDKHQVFLENKHVVSETAVVNTRDAVSRAIKTKKRILDNFVENNHEDITRLIRAPQQKLVFDKLFNKLKKQLPDLFTINVYKQGDGLVTQFDGFVGKICQQDLKDFLLMGHHLKRTHPSKILIHYDEISALKFAGSNYLFFASFAVNEMASTIKHATPEGHNIFIMNDGDEGRVEILGDGARSHRESQDSPLIPDLDSPLVLSSRDIVGTHWTVVDIKNEREITDSLRSLVIPAIFIFILVAVIILFMRNVLGKSFLLLSSLNEELIRRNKEITGLNLELEDLSVTDSLTGLFNRRYFDAEFEKEWNRSLREKSMLAILIVDIDFFKKYNDFYGHLEGDHCLKKIAGVLNSCFSRSNEFVARYGGEEFIAVINGNVEECLIIAEAIHSKIELMNLEHKGSDKKRVSVSIGIYAGVPDNDEDRFTAIKKADDALYKAKTQGRNQSQVSV